MAYRFVSLTNGERDIHWMRLAVFSFLTFVAVPMTVGLSWLWMTGRWSHEALFVAGFFAALIVIRTVLKAYAVPERELTSDESRQDSASPPRADVSGNARKPESLAVGS